MKKLLILAGVIALTSTMQTFAQEQPKAEGPCPLKKIECAKPNMDCQEKFKKAHCERIQKFEQELKLTDEQKAKAKALRESEAEKIKPILDQMKVKHDQMQEIFNEKLTLQERQEKLAPIRKDLFELRKQIKDIKCQGKKDFEALLTNKQLKKLEKIKKEHREEFKKNHPGRMMHRRPHPPVVKPCPVPPEQEPLPAEDEIPVEE